MGRGAANGSQGVGKKAEGEESWQGVRWWWREKKKTIRGKPLIVPSDAALHFPEGSPHWTQLHRGFHSGSWSSKSSFRGGTTFLVTHLL